MEKQAQMELKEIIVITDGRSNIGGNPSDAARISRSKGIIVNTIGILDKTAEEFPYMELDEIAREGGGVCDIVPLSELSVSMQMITTQSVQMTIENAVSKQLKKITGHSLQDIEPASRSRLIEYINKAGEEVTLKCAILLDCSGSMANKLDSALDSIQELLISLQARKGVSSIAVLAFPGKRGEECQIISTFTGDFDYLSSRLKGLTARGATPTHGGIMAAVDMFTDEENTCYSSRVNVY